MRAQLTTRSPSSAPNIWSPSIGARTCVPSLHPSGIQTLVSISACKDGRVCELVVSSAIQRIAGNNIQTRLVRTPAVAGVANVLYRIAPSIAARETDDGKVTFARIWVPRLESRGVSVTIRTKYGQEDRNRRKLRMSNQYSQTICALPNGVAITWCPVPLQDCDK